MSITLQTSLCLAILFCGIGCYAWRREKPMWFWSGTTVKPENISDIPAYNHANAIMWWVYSLLYWGAALIFRTNQALSEIIMAIAATIGLIPLCIAYTLIYRKYRKKEERKEK